VNVDVLQSLLGFHLSHWFVLQRPSGRAANMMAPRKRDAPIIRGASKATRPGFVEWRKCCRSRLPNSHSYPLFRAFLIRAKQCGSMIDHLRNLSCNAGVKGGSMRIIRSQKSQKLLPSVTSRLKVIRRRALPEFFRVVWTSHTSHEGIEDKIFPPILAVEPTFTLS